MSWNNSMNGMYFRIIKATEALVVGDTYFLSSFNDQQGAMVKVLSKSTEKNSAGWPSSVEIEVIEPIGYEKDAFGARHYKPGMKHIVNATNLYKRREDAKPKPRYPFRRRPAA